MLAGCGGGGGLINDVTGLLNHIHIHNKLYIFIYEYIDDTKYLVSHVKTSRVNGWYL